MASADNGFGYFVRTKNAPHRFRLVWTVENFLEYPAKVGTALSSPHFLSTTGENHGVEWYMIIYPYGVNYENKDCISVFLYAGKLPKRISDISAKFDVSLLNKNQDKINTLTELTLKHHDWKKNGMGWDQFIKREVLQENKNQYLSDGHITIECNVEAYFHFEDLVQITTVHSVTSGITPSDLGVEILERVYREKICADFRLKASDGRVFDAHKCVLSARSPYFMAMFQHQMKENEEGVVDLSEDMNGQEVESLLEYIYLGKPPANLKEKARKMFQIGDMRGIQGLCQLSEEALIGQLNDSNALELLNFANENGAKKLKKAAARQIANSD